jgi:hypothetical protein
MSSDPVARVLLALILACMLVLVFQGFGNAGDAGRLLGRFQVIGMRAGAPVLIRTDTESGQVWKLELRGGGNQWIPFTEKEAEQEGGDERASARESQTREVARVEREVVEPPGAPSAAEAPPPAATPGETPASASPVLQEEIESMADALANPELPNDMRTWAADQLGRMDAPDSTTALLAALNDPDPEIVLAAIDALRGRDDPRIEPALAALGEHPDERVADRAMSVD